MKTFLQAVAVIPLFVSLAIIGFFFGIFEGCKKLIIRVKSARKRGL
jgi:hypothetical protein